MHLEEPASSRHHSRSPERWPSGATVWILKRVLAVSVLVAVLGGCDLRFDSYYRVGHESVGPEGDAGVTRVMPWGTWAASLPVPDCPPGEVLTVDTVADELEGGSTIDDRVQAGERLSLPEALWIAANRAGPDTILFDAEVFPVAMPATILLNGSHALPWVGAVCIDGRNRGVVVRWSDSARASNSSLALTYIWGLQAGSLQVGLQLLNPPAGLRVESDAQVAGCRFHSESPNHRPQESLVELLGGAFEPGNVVSGQVYCLRGFGTVRESYFGYNPLTGEKASCLAAVNHLWNSSRIERNVISATGTGVLGGNGSMLFNNNLIGVGHGDILLDVPGSALDVQMVAASIGPGNHIRANLVGVGVHTAAAPVAITRNSIVAPEGIKYIFGTCPVAKPTIIAASPNQVSGSCPVPGLIEVFSGEAAGQAETFLGDVACAASENWTLTASPTSGTTLIATLTDAAARTSLFSQPFEVP